MSTTWVRAVLAPSRRIRAKAKGWSRGWCGAGSGTVDEGERDPPGLLDELPVAAELGQLEVVAALLADAEDGAVPQAGEEGTDDRTE